MKSFGVFGKSRTRNIIKTMKKLITTTSAAIAAIGFTSLGLIADEPANDGDALTKKEYQDMKDLTVVDLASGDERFTTLVKALRAADLAEALDAEGPFTIFAPTDEAFEKLPAGVLEDLMKPENKEKLASVLKYHVVPGKIMASDVKPMKASTLNGSEFVVTVVDEEVRIDNATVIKTDIVGTNGVIHVIDSVIMPNR